MKGLISAPLNSRIIISRSNPPLSVSLLQCHDKEFHGIFSTQKHTPNYRCIA